MAQQQTKASGENDELYELMKKVWENRPPSQLIQENAKRKKVHCVVVWLFCDCVWFLCLFLF